MIASIPIESEATAAPQRFIQVTTPEIMRAKELMGIYNDLKSNSLDTEERLTVLLNTKIMVGSKLNHAILSSSSKDKYTMLMNDILELIQREADLLNRSRPDKSLAGLRTRLANLFLQFIEKPDELVGPGNAAKGTGTVGGPDMQKTRSQNSDAR